MDGSARLRRVAAEIDASADCFAKVAQFKRGLVKNNRSDGEAKLRKTASPEIQKSSDDSNTYPSDGDEQKSTS